MKKFKDFWKDINAEKMDEYMTTLGIRLKQKTVDTDYAGAIPNSLLAEQDLETSKALSTFAVWYYDKRGNQMCATFNNQIDADAFAEDLKSIGCTDIEVLAKGKVEQTGKKLETEAEKAKEADTETEVKSVAENIKAIQVKRQEATMQARAKAISKKSFKDLWNGLKK